MPSWPTSTTIGLQVARATPAHRPRRARSGSAMRTGVLLMCRPRCSLSAGIAERLTIRRRQRRLLHWEYDAVAVDGLVAAERRIDADAANVDPTVLCPPCVAEGAIVRGG